MSFATDLRLPRRSVPAIGSRLLAGCVLLVLAGCGSASSSSDQSDGPSAKATVDEDVATVEQYASIVAKRQPKSIGQTEDCNWFGRGGLDWDPTSMQCSLGLLGLETEAAILQLELTGASDEDSGLYIGAVPDEIETLADDTIDASTKLRKAASQANKQDCGLSGTGVCVSLRADVLTAAGDLSSEIDAWAPYL